MNLEGLRLVGEYATHHDAVEAAKGRRPAIVRTTAKGKFGVYEFVDSSEAASTASADAHLPDCVISGAVDGVAESQLHAQHDMGRGDEPTSATPRSAPCLYCAETLLFTQDGGWVHAGDGTLLRIRGDRDDHLALPDQRSTATKAIVGRWRRPLIDEPWRIAFLELRDAQAREAMAREKWQAGTLSYDELQMHRRALTAAWRELEAIKES